MALRSSTQARPSLVGRPSAVPLRASTARKSEAQNNHRTSINQQTLSCTSEDFNSGDVIQSRKSGMAGLLRMASQGGALGTNPNNEGSSFSFYQFLNASKKTADSDEMKDIDEAALKSAAKVADPEEEEYDEIPAHGCVTHYWKEHAHALDCWPNVKEMRERNLAFVQAWEARNGGMQENSRRPSMASAQQGEAGPQQQQDKQQFRAFVNICRERVGVRRSATQDPKERTEKVIYPGECVMVEEVRQDRSKGIEFLKLSDEQGWVFASKDKDGAQLMVELKDLEIGLKWYRIKCPQYVETRQAPTFDKAYRNGFVMCPNELAVVSMRCNVGGADFAYLSDGRGWLFESMPNLHGEPGPAGGDDIPATIQVLQKIEARLVHGVTTATAYYTVPTAAGTRNSREILEDPDDYIVKNKNTEAQRYSDMMTMLRRWASTRRMVGMSKDGSSKQSESGSSKNSKGS